MNYKLTIPPNVTEAQTVKQSYDIGRALVRVMIVHIPDGHKYLAHFQVRTKGRLILPEFGSGELWMVGNSQDIVIRFPQPLTLDGPPYEITLIGWNEDDTYSHAFILEVQ